ncbi:MAG: ASKHA domain-containing protein [Eubacterium sp.]
MAEKIEIRILQEGQAELLKAEKGDNLLRVLQKNKIFIPVACGGNGTCGMCRVRIRRGGKDSEIKSVLACRTRVEENMTVMMKSWSEDDIVTEGAENPTVQKEGSAPQETAASSLEKSGKSGQNESIRLSPDQRYSAAVDLGTTTIAAALVINDHSGKAEVISRRGSWNRQAAFGADVISRIQYIIESSDDGLGTLMDTVRDQIRDMILDMYREKKINASQIDDLYIAGNTIMQHIFFGISPVSIASAPFTPETLFLESESPNYDEMKRPFSEEWKEDFPSMKVYGAPCAAGYVGGDILSGLSACGISEEDGQSLFLDIGTNGEMAIGGKNGLLCCAVASGPAFEGAQIECGMTASAGAVSQVSLRKGKLELNVIGGGEPEGICGSGLIDLLAVLLESGAVDESGYFLSPEEAEEEAFPAIVPFIREDEDGNGMIVLDQKQKVRFTAQDVRKLQLAKAAVAAGIEVLMKEAGVQAEDVPHLYLAGGFGKHVNLRSAARIGMFPKELVDKAVYLGNASLLGMEKACADRSAYEKMQKITTQCRYLELSGNAAFNDAYIGQMMFGDETDEEE